MFAKGANYIPQDALLTNVTTERYQTLFRDIREANMNVIRVWGGGTYEDDRFYDLADENGILVWQDFMFACTPYPSDPTFLKRVEAEACYNIRRLRNHASLAMWCGNNEILEALNIGDSTRTSRPKSIRKCFEATTNCSISSFQPRLRNWMPTVSTYTAPRILPTGGVLNPGG